MSEEAIQQSLFEEQNRIDMAEFLARTQKTAFRVAFDFLVRNDPPKNTEEYWLKFAEDIKETAGAYMNNELCQKLLTAVVLYLDEKQKVMNDAEKAKASHEAG